MYLAESLTTFLPVVRFILKHHFGKSDVERRFSVSSRSREIKIPSRGKVGSFYDIELKWFIACDLPNVYDRSASSDLKSEINPRHYPRYYGDCNASGTCSRLHS